MKLVSLNIWRGGAGLKKLCNFFKKYEDVDVFCLQEVAHGSYDTHRKHVEGRTAGGATIENYMFELYSEIGKTLKGHNGYFRPHFRDFFGLAMFAKKNMKITEEGDVFVYKERGHIPEGDLGNHARNIQYMGIETAVGKRTVVNFHGLWTGKGKLDSEDRLRQSDNVLRFLKTVSDPFVLCGDFNLLPETKSLKKFEHFGLKNLIKEFGITSTRSSFYTKSNRFADYIFVSKRIKINEFKTLPDEASDHLALYLDFE